MNVLSNTQHSPAVMLLESRSFLRLLFPPSPASVSMRSHDDPPWFIDYVRDEQEASDEASDVTALFLGWFCQ